MKMKRTCKLLSLLLTLALVAALLPTAALAVTEYEVWVGSTQVTAANKGDILGDGKASFDPNTNTLTLNNVTGVTGTHGDAQIHSNLTGGLNINVIGSLTLKDSSVTFGICVDTDDLTITGNVDLEARVKAIFISNGDLTIDGQVTAKGEYGLDAQGMTLKTGPFNITSTESYGIFAKNDLTIEGDVTSKNGGYGIYSYYGNIAITGNVNVEATSEAICTVLGTLTINGKVTAKGKTALEAQGIMTLKTGPFNITSTENYGIYASAGLTIEGEMTSESGFYGIYSPNNDITINGNATVKATGDYGILSKNGKIILQSGKLDSTAARCALFAVGGIQYPSDYVITTPTGGAVESNTTTIGSTSFTGSTVKDATGGTVATHAVVEYGAVKYPVTGGNIWFDKSTGTIVDCDKSVTAANIPAQIDGVAVTTIGDVGKNGFKGCVNLTRVTIPDSVSVIWNNAFEGCTGLTDLTMGENMEEIGGSAFQGCTSLTSVTIPSNVYSMESNAFSGCTSLKSVTINATSLDSIEDYLFAGCTSLESVTIPDSVEYIKESAFSGCTSLTSVTFEGDAPAVGTDAFPSTATLYYQEDASGWTTPKWNGYDTKVLGYTVSFDAGGGSGSMADVTGVSGSYTLPASGFTAPEGKQFKGWKVGDEEKAPGAAITVTADVTVTALWADISTEEPPAEESWVPPEIVSEGVDPDASGTAYAATQEVEVDGVQITFQMYALKDPETGYMTNYVKLRDVARVINGTAAQYSVGWTAETGVTANRGTAYEPDGTEMHTPFSGDRAYTRYDQTTGINGHAVAMKAFQLTDDQGGGYTYYKLRDLGQALGFNVGWDADRGVYIDTTVIYSFGD